ncbi:MAG: hypothetical protein HY721_04475 [Planctomycetes bacterium]|nr:hypothetical protein [Planctomycetota bacterium]
MRARGVDFDQAGKGAVRFSHASSEENIREAAQGVVAEPAERFLAGLLGLAVSVYRR